MAISVGAVRARGSRIPVWEHEPPCPLAPHHTAASRNGEVLRLRMLFATEPERDVEVRQRIEQALRTGWLTGPVGVVSESRFAGARPGEIGAADAEPARRPTDA